ncbi:MAG: hypothetical protein K2P81_15410 [Bacteriovoracaceae bacterium]|nr:hypothetical protein [Bacteriovoracaceae bacterium]
MMKTNFLFLLFFVSCSSFIKSLELDAGAPKYIKTAPVEEVTCAKPATRAPELVGTNPAAQRVFSDFLRSIESLNLEFKEKIVLWSLVQMNLRPDLASPTARFQFMARSKGESQYRDFTASESEEGSFPFFAGLEYLLSKTSKKRPLLWYATLLDEKLSAPFMVGKQLELRLMTMSKEIAENEELRRFFFRGDELIRESERLTKVRFRSLVEYWQKNRKASPSGDTLFSYRKTPQLNVRCNYDFTLYDNSIFLIDKEENVGHIFGMTLGEDSFLAVTAQKTPAPMAINNQPVFAGSAKVRSSAFCMIENKDNEIWVTANQSRDPGQHVYHLFRYGLSKAESQTELKRLFHHARHMFLSDPLRLVIESSRSRNKQVQELLKLNVPIYNAQSIGNIWGWANFHKKGGNFYIDDRNPGALFCAP